MEGRPIGRIELLVAVVQCEASRGRASTGTARPQPAGGARVSGYLAIATAVPARPPAGAAEWAGRRQKSVNCAARHNAACVASVAEVARARRRGVVTCDTGCAVEECRGDPGSCGE